MDQKGVRPLQVKKDELCNPTKLPIDELTFHSKHNIKDNHESLLDETDEAEIPPIFYTIWF